MSDWLIYSIGFIAQLLFSSRLIIQWVTSEKQRKVITPTTFWTLSLAASFLLFIYGYLRNDFAIMLGQTITYFIYIRNLQLQKEWSKLPTAIRFLLYAIPTLLVIYYFNNNIIRWLLWLGIVSQVVFTFRFVYQWIYSEFQKKSALPLGFWLLSLVGAILILIYAIYRRDPVLLIGHLLGTLIYTRNIVLLHKQDDSTN